MTRTKSHVAYISTYKQHLYNSHAFRDTSTKAQRLLSYRFPCLRGASRVKVRELIMFLPEGDFHADVIARFTRALARILNDF